MCIIAIKPAGTPLPSREQLARLWRRNPDGAGFMVPVRGRVVIEKGFMALEDLLGTLALYDDRYGIDGLPLVLHFRIATHGGVNPACTHPFPLSARIGDLRMLRVACDVGIVHNGIIPIHAPASVSDTQAYIMRRLAPMGKRIHTFYRIPDVQAQIAAETHSRIAIMDASGSVYEIGTFYDGGDGLRYSNMGYQ